MEQFNQWFGLVTRNYLMLPFSDSHFDSIRFVSNLVRGFCSKFSPALPKVYACASQHITRTFFCNGTMQFSPVISALLETPYFFFSLPLCVLYLFGRSNKAEWEAGCHCYQYTVDVAAAADSTQRIW